MSYFYQDLEAEIKTKGNVIYLTVKNDTDSKAFMCKSYSEVFAILIDMGYAIDFAMPEQTIIPEEEIRARYPHLMDDDDL